MLVILIIVCAMVFFFCIFTIILHGVAKDKLKVEERIKDFVLEEKEERKKTTTATEKNSAINRYDRAARKKRHFHSWNAQQLPDRQQKRKDPVSREENA